MNIFKAKTNSQEYVALSYMIENLNQALEEKRGILQKLNKTQGTIDGTRKLIHDKKRAATGCIPISPYLDICASLRLDPAELFSRQLLDAEQKNNEAEDEIKKLREIVDDEIASTEKRLFRLKELSALANSAPDTLDHQVFRVLRNYFEKKMDITVDEAVGIVLARMYQSCHDPSAVMSFATRGKLALQETGNCAVDVVFDPELRKSMSKRYGQLNGKWTRHVVMKEYLKISEQSPDYSTVKAFRFNPHSLKQLPESILYGLVVCGDHHAMRILEVESLGIRVVEGNVDGHLRFGHFVPFSELVWGDDLIVYSRLPCESQGLSQEFSLYDFTNPDAVGFESIKETMDDLQTFSYFKLTTPGMYQRILIPVRDSLSILRFRPGKTYDITYYSDLVDFKDEFFPHKSNSEVISAFLKKACENPTGQIIALTICTNGETTDKFSSYTRPIPIDATKSMFIFYDKEDGEKISIFEQAQITESIREKYGNKVPRMILLSINEFLEMDEDQKRSLAILSPRRDDHGIQIDVNSYFEEQIMRVCPSNPEMLVEDDTKREIPLADLMQNPLHALILIETPFNLMGSAIRLTPHEIASLNKYPFKTSEAEIRRSIERKFAIRSNHLQTK